MAMNAKEMLEKINHTKAEEAKKAEQRKAEAMLKSLAKAKSDIMSLAKSTFFNSLKKGIGFDEDYCVTYRASRFEEYLKEFLETLDENLILEGFFLQFGGIPYEKIMFKRGVFNFAIEESKISKEEFKGKNYCPRTLRIQVLKYGIALPRMFRNCLNLYPDKEVMQKMLSVLDTEGKLRFYETKREDFETLLQKVVEENPEQEVLILEEGVYALCYDGGVHIAYWDEDCVPELLRKNHPFVFDVRYVPKKKE